MLAVCNLRISLGHAAATAQEQPIRQLHDVGLVNGVDFLALILSGILESKFRDARRSLLRDDLQAFHHTGDDLVLQPGVQTLGILAHDDEIYIGITRGNMRQIPNGTEIRIQLKFPAQRNVDAGKPAAHRRGHRALQTHASALDRLKRIFRDVFTVLFERIGAHLK